MRIVIVGAGEVGYHIGRRLVQEGHDIVVVEESDRIRERLQQELDALIIQGNGAAPRTLEQAGIDKTDMLIAVTDVDEVNLVSCLIAKQYGVRTTIARARDPELSASPFLMAGNRLGIDLVINPNQVVADEIAKLVLIPSAAQAAFFAEGKVQLLGVNVGKGAPLLGKQLKELKSYRTTHPFVVVAISREDTLLIPGGDTSIQEGDHLYTVTAREDTTAILDLLGRHEAPPRNVFIIGGGRVGLALAEQLSAGGIHVKLMERRPDRCSALADQLTRVLILEGDGTDIESLRAEGIATMDAVVTVSDDEATNILAALLAKREGAQKVIALIHRSHFLHLAASLGIDAAISPRLTTASVILKFARRGRVVSLVELPEWEAETMEMIVPPSSSAVDKRIRDIRIPQHTIIGAISRGEEIIIPRGDTQIRASDRVVIFTLPSAIPKVEELFAT